MLYDISPMQLDRAAARHLKNLNLEIGSGEVGNKAVDMTLQASFKF
jgi:hypothetical protein